MKRISSLLAIFLLSSFVLVPVSVLAQCSEPMVTIEKYPYCMKTPEDPGYNPELDDFSSNPPYTTGTKYYWWISITVSTTLDLSGYDVVVYDRLGGEFMIEGICIDTPKQPDDLKDYPGTVPGGFAYQPFDYDFVYNYGTPYEPISDGPVEVFNDTATLVEDGYVNEDGIEFGEFFIYWTGNSCKAHFQWNIGPMNDETRTIFLVISTDKNPAGHQEFTSPGITYLNSGATVKVRRPHPRLDKWIPIYSASTAPIPIEVEES